MNMIFMLQVMILHDYDHHHVLDAHRVRGYYKGKAQTTMINPQLKDL